MKRLLLSIVLPCAVTAGALAAESNMKINSDPQKAHTPGMQIVLPSDSQKPQKENGQFFTVMPDFVYDMNKANPGFIQFAINQETGVNYDAYVMGMEFMEPWSLPAGTYTFVCPFDNLSFGQEDSGLHLIVKENVEVNSDMSVTIDYSDATNLLSAEIFLPDGSELVPPTWDNENTQWQDKGNIAAGKYCYMFVGKNTRWSFRTQGSLENSIDSRGLINCMLDARIWVSDNNFLSAFFTAGAGCLNGPTAIFCEGAPTTESHVFSNQGEKYDVVDAEFGETYTYTPNGRSLSSFEFRGGAEGRIYSSSSVNSFGVIGADPSWNPDNVALCALNMEGWEMMPGFSNETYYDGGEALGIEGPFYKIKGNEVIYSTFNEWQIANLNPAVALQNPWMQETSQIGTTAKFGFEVPVITYLRNYRNRPVWGFIGRHGENRAADQVKANLDVKNGGNTVVSDFKDLYDWFRNSDNASMPGVWDIHVEDQSVIIDGIQGVSTLDLTLSPENSSYSTPAITQIQMRNIEGDVTDNFNEASQGIMLIEGGVFADIDEYDEASDNTYSYWLGIAPEVMTVEYAPSGSGEYLPLNAELLSAEDQRLLGVTWTVGLEGVTSESQNGWYDVRITMQNGADTMVQTFGPAFHIAQPGAIDSINIEAAGNGIKEIFTIHGQKVSGVALQPGIYVIKTGNKAAKTIIK